MDSRKRDGLGHAVSITHCTDCGGDLDALPEPLAHFHYGAFVGFALGCNCPCGHKNIRLLTPREDCGKHCEGVIEVPKSTIPAPVAGGKEN